MSRLAHSRAVVRELREATDRILLMLSGGKDSAACLALCAEAFEGHQMSACFLYLVPGLRLVEEPLDAICRRYGIKRLVKLPDPAMADQIASGLFTVPRHPSLDMMVSYTYTDVERLALELTDNQGAYTVYGQRSMDSLHRRGMISAWGEVDHGHKRAYPIAEWNEADANGYCQAMKLPVQPRLGDTVRMSGVNLSPAVLRDIKAKYPADFARICEVFPFAPVQLMADS